MAGRRTPQPWEEKRQQTERLVNACIDAKAKPPSSSQEAAGAEALDTTKPKAEMSYTFEARRQFQQVMAKQQRASDERKFFASEKGLGVPSCRVGPTSLSSPNGLRGHFHNSVGVKSAYGSHRWPQSLDVGWDGAHIDHTRAEELRPNPKMSKMDAGTRAKQFSCYFGKGDLTDAKCQKAAAESADTGPYMDPGNPEFREDIPQRHGKFGRRAFNAQVGFRHYENPHGISEIDNKPQEEFLREQERVMEFLDRSLPPRQTQHFKPYLPKAQEPHRYEEMSSRKQVISQMSGGQKTTALGYGQMRFSDNTDFRLYARPLNTSQMDRAVPLS
mmetsp:Transcript_25878/g.59995  ORF Transcript_25878/g.59995 Transcript_25878/m.59995 type:complete len:330 (-) Transcript_25878:129-1118(-)